MRKVLGLTLFVSAIFVAESAYAGPLTRADFAYLDVPAQALHNKITQLRAGGSKTILDISGGGGGEDIVQYLNNTSGQSYTNTTALQTIMGDWAGTPKTFGVIGDYQPSGHENSLYHKIAHTSGSVFADLGYDQTNIKDKINSGLFGDLGGTSGSAFERMGAIFGALESKVGTATIPARNTDENLWSWISRISSGGGGDDIVQYLNNTSGQSYTNTTALQTIMGDWAGTPKTFGVIGDYQPSGHENSLYHKIAHTSGSVFADLGYDQTNIKDKINSGLFGDLGGSSGSASARMGEIFGALDGKVGTATIPARSGRNLLNWINGISSGGGEDIVQYLNNTSGQSYTNTTALQTIMGDWAAATKTFGVIGDYQPSGHENSLYHKIADPDGGNCVFADLGYAPTNIKDKINTGLFAELGGAADTSASARMTEIFGALEGKGSSPYTIPPRTPATQDLLSWINNFMLYVPPENEIVPYLNNTSGQSYTNTTALQTIMGDWAGTPKTFGVIGDYQPSGHENSLYHKIAHTSGSVFADLRAGYSLSGFGETSVKQTVSNLCTCIGILPSGFWNPSVASRLIVF